MQFSMFNLRTLYQTGKLDQLLRGARNLPLDIIGIQEHQWITKETLSQYWNDECEFMSIYSSAFQPQVGGVVLLICKIFANSYMAAEKVSEQILKVYFKGNPLIVMFVIYAPSNVANDSDKAAFFNDLHKVSKEQPHSIVIMHDPDPRTTSRLRSSNFSLL